MREYKKRTEGKCEIDRLADIWQKTKDDTIGLENFSTGTLQIIYDKWWDNYLSVCKEQIKEKRKSKSLEKHFKDTEE